MLIIRGRNFYPQDVEMSAETVGSKLGSDGVREPGFLRAGCTAAFSVPMRVVQGVADQLGMQSAAQSAATLASISPDALVVVGEIRSQLPSNRSERVELLHSISS